MGDLEHEEQSGFSVRALEEKFSDEAAIVSGEARLALRTFLFERAGETQLAGSVADALFQLSSKPGGDVVAACVALRALAVHGLMPTPGSLNQLERSLVSLCDSSVPDIVSFLRISDKLQTFEEFAALSKTHSRIAELLSPVRLPYGDLEALVAARNDIIGSMRHSIVRRYAGPFGLKEFRSTIEAVLGKLKRVANLELSLMTDVEEAGRAISSARTEAQAFNSFLNADFLIPFLDTCEFVIRELPSITTRQIRHSNSK